MLDGWKKALRVALETRSQFPLLFFCFLRFLFIPAAFLLSSLIWISAYFSVGGHKLSSCRKSFNYVAFFASYLKNLYLACLNESIIAAE